MNLPAYHLSETARKLLVLSDQERIQRIIKPRWIGYTKAKQILDKLEELINYPKTHRMPNLLIVGDTNNGKTMIINRFYSKYPANDNPEQDSVNVPVLMIQAPETPDEGRFYNAILEKLFAPYRIKDHCDKKKFQIISIFKKIGLKMLIIDEIHDILAGSLLKQRQLLAAIKHLSNELKIPIVGVGTKEAFNALQTDQQLSNRFEPAILLKWQFNDEYLSLLASFEQIVPLQKPSNLTEDNIALKLLSMSEGTIGEISTIINKAAEKAITTKEECINIKLLEKLGWIPPSERKWRTS